MDIRTDNQATQIREVIDRALYRVNTSIPGTIESFDPATQTATVVPSIKLRTFIDGVERFVSLPPIVNVPVCVYSASTKGFAITIPISKGDPCLIQFSQRSIDHWHELGGEQPPEDGLSSRHHDLTDAIAIMSPLPLPVVFSHWDSDGIEIRNRARDSRVSVYDDRIEVVTGSASIIVNTDGTIVVTGPTKATITTPLLEVISANSTFSGNVNVAGKITGTGAGGIESVGDIKTTGGDIESLSGDVKDSVRSMADDRVIYSGHDHDENGDGGGVTDPPNQEQ